jgi:hypothetical protein
MKVFFFFTVVVGVYREDWQATFVWWKQPNHVLVNEYMPGQGIMVSYHA